MEHTCPPDWQYENHPKRKKLAARVAEQLANLRKKRTDGLRLAKDSRPFHGDLFKDLTPAHFTYFAGHYRGEQFRCLSTWTCGIPGDQRVGAHPSAVGVKVNELADWIEKAVAEMDK